MWVEGDAIKIIGALKHMVGGEFWVYARGPEHVQRVLFLLDNFAPQDGWKIFVARAESYNCVVLDGLDVPLCFIGVVFM